jgi:transposase
MAFREVTMLEVKEVLLQWLEGRAVKRIAAAVGVDPKTARRYVRAAEKEGLASAAGTQLLSEDKLAQVLVRVKGAPARAVSEGRARCVAEREFIEHHVQHGVRLTKVRQLLVRKGVNVSYALLRRYAMAELGFGKRALTVPVVDAQPGEELQLDVGKITLRDSNGHPYRIKAFVFTPNVSRYRFVYVAERETTADAIMACEAAWEFYGGIFATILVDNAKAIVDTADPLGAKLTDTFLDYAQTHGFHVETTRVRDPKGKSRVERSIRVVRDDCFGGEVLRDIEHAQVRARYWAEHTYGMRRHTTTGRMPKEHFQTVEAPQLKPAPSERYDIPTWTEPRVARDQLAPVAGALYSLPTKYVGQKLRVRADRNTVRFYAREGVIKVHPRQPVGGKSIDPHDLPDEKRAYAMRDADFLRQQAESHGKAIGAFAVALLQGPLPWTRLRQIYAVLGLVRRYGAERVETACDIALTESMHDVRRLARMIEQNVRPEPQPLAKVILIGRYLRPAQQYAMKPTERNNE